MDKRGTSIFGDRRMKRLTIFIEAYGPVGSGKTTILTKLQRYLRSENFIVSDVVQKPSFNKPVDRVFVEGIFAELGT